MTAPLTNIPGCLAEQAVCGQADPDAWFPDQGRTVATARRICAACRPAGSAPATPWCCATFTVSIGASLTAGMPG
jgi:hypothetical protein